jgi:hypothetical protein
MATSKNVTIIILCDGHLKRLDDKTETANSSELARNNAYASMATLFHHNFLCHPVTGERVCFSFSFAAAAANAVLSSYLFKWASYRTMEPFLGVSGHYEGLFSQCLLL